MVATPGPSPTSPSSTYVPGLRTTSGAVGVPAGNIAPPTGYAYNANGFLVNGSGQMYVAPTAPAPTGGSAPTPTDSSTGIEDSVAQGLGYKSYSDAVSQLTTPPSESETQMYNDAYSAAGLDSLQATITGKQNDLAKAVGNINDNPWLDESSRVGRANTVQTLANADIKNAQDAYNAGLKEVEDLVTRESNDQNATQTSNKAKLAALEAQAKQAVTDSTAAAKTANTAPKTVKGASGATYKWDPTSQSFVQILPPKGPASSGPTGKPDANSISTISGVMDSVKGQDGKISPVDWQSALNEWMSAGYSESTFVSNFKSYANTKDPTQHYAGLN